MSPGVVFKVQVVMHSHLMDLNSIFGSAVSLHMDVFWVLCAFSLEDINEISISPLIDFNGIALVYDLLDIVDSVQG